MEGTPASQAWLTSFFTPIQESANVTGPTIMQTPNAGTASPVWCHMFVQTLMGSTRLWYDSLPMDSIDGFEDLQHRFRNNFMQQRKCERKSVEMHNIKQREHESLRTFIERFNKESLEIKGATEDIRVSGFMHAIRNTQLIEFLNNKDPDTVEEMMARVRDFIRGKEAANLGREIGLGGERASKQMNHVRGDTGSSQRNERKAFDMQARAPYTPQEYRKRKYSQHSPRRNVKSYPPKRWEKALHRHIRC